MVIKRGSFLDCLGNSNKMRVGLDEVRGCLNLLGSKIVQFGEYLSTTPSVIVGGTNGKGSSLSYLATLLSFYGIRVGVYSSPHLVDVRERIYVSGSLVSDEELDSYTDTLISVLKQKFFSLTYFEKLTLIAGYAFYKKQTKFNIFEVGMGGVFDATRIYKSALSIITGISKDHTKYLGDSLDDIFEQKAGIIQEEGGYTFFSDLAGVSKDKIESIKNRIRKNGTTIYEYKKDWSLDVSSGSFWINTCDFGMDSKEDASGDKDGEFQFPVFFKDKPVLEKNFVLSFFVFIFVVKKLFRLNVDSKEISRILKLNWDTTLKVNLSPKPKSSQTQDGVFYDTEVLTDCKFRIIPTLFGRYQNILMNFQDGSSKLLRLDCCHNDDGVKTFLNRVLGLKSKGEKSSYVAVVSIFKDKDYRSMLQRLSQVFSKIYIFQSESERSIDRESVVEFFSTVDFKDRFKFYSSFDLLWKDCKDRYDDFWVCGSIYGVGQLLRYFGIRPSRIYGS